MVPVDTQAFPATPKNTDICTRSSYFEKEQTLGPKVENSNFQSWSTPHRKK
jgi:hypothetical protein